MFSLKVFYYYILLQMKLPKWTLYYFIFIFIFRLMLLLYLIITSLISKINIYIDLNSINLLFDNINLNNLYLNVDFYNLLNNLEMLPFIIVILNNIQFNLDGELSYYNIKFTEYLCNVPITNESSTPSADLHLVSEMDIVKYNEDSRKENANEAVAPFSNKDLFLPEFLLLKQNGDYVTKDLFHYIPVNGLYINNDLFNYVQSKYGWHNGQGLNNPYIQYIIKGPDIKLEHLRMDTEDIINILKDKNFLAIFGGGYPIHREEDIEDTIGKLIRSPAVQFVYDTGNGIFQYAFKYFNPKTYSNIIKNANVNLLVTFDDKPLRACDINRSCMKFVHVPSEYDENNFGKFKALEYPEQNKKHSISYIVNKDNKEIVMDNNAIVEKSRSKNSLINKIAFRKTKLEYYKTLI